MKRHFEANEAQGGTAVRVEQKKKLKQEEGKEEDMDKKTYVVSVRFFLSSAFF